MSGQPAGRLSTWLLPPMKMLENQVSLQFALYDEACLGLEVEVKGNCKQAVENFLNENGFCCIYRWRYLA